MRWRDRAQLSYFPTVAGPELAGCVSGLRVAIPRQEFPPMTKPTSSRDGARSKTCRCATWKFGMRPCGGNGKRATPSALSLSQTHCRAALLLSKPRAMTESGPARPGDSQGRNLPHEDLQEVLPSQTSHPSIEIAWPMRRPSRRPNAIQAELGAPMRPRGTAGSNPVPSSGESVANSHLSAEHANVLAARLHAP